MSSPQAAVINRISALTAVRPTAQQRSTVESVLREAGGDWSKAEPVLRERLPVSAMHKVSLANDLAEWSNDDIPRSIQGRPAHRSLAVSTRCRRDCTSTLRDPNTQQRSSVTAEEHQ